MILDAFPLALVALAAPLASAGTLALANRGPVPPGNTTTGKPFTENGLGTPGVLFNWTFPSYSPQVWFQRGPLPIYETTYAWLDYDASLIALNITADQISRVWVTMEIPGTHMWAFGSVTQSTAPGALAPGVGMGPEFKIPTPRIDLAGPTLVEMEWPDFGSRHINLVLVPGGALNLTSFVWTMGALTDDSVKTIDDVPKTTVPFVRDGAANKDIGFRLSRGTTSPRTTVPGLADTPHLFLSTSAEMYIPLPANSTFVVLNGSIGPDTDEVIMAFTPPAMAFPRWTDPGNWRRYNCTRPFTANVDLIVWPLDPTIKYEFYLKLSEQSAGLRLYSLTTWGMSKNGTEGEGGVSGGDNGGSSSDAGSGSPSSSPSVSSPKTSNAGSIAGGVVGGVVGVALLGALFWWLWRRKSKAQGKPSKRADLVELASKPSSTVSLSEASHATHRVGQPLPAADRPTLTPFTDFALSPLRYDGASAARPGPHEEDTASSFSATLPASTPRGRFGLSLRTDDIAERPQSLGSAVPKSALTSAPHTPFGDDAAGQPEVDAGPLPARPPPTYNPNWTSSNQSPSTRTTPTDSTGNTLAYDSMKLAILLERQEEEERRSRDGRDR
ncbi:hypothetical protein Q8F55_002953 [Vanrija albida]|uniref:Peptidase A1 domain-containing protein n=1 Tax=Vanrija albida TaxID=181172 RepID=A0ABR3QB69_9TREE